MNICFTGHRPNKLGGYDWNTQKNKDIMEELASIIHGEIENATIQDDDIHFITGGALGVDQMAFEICHIASGSYVTHVKITTEIAVPFLDQDCKWRSNDVNRYYSQVLFADKVVYVDKLDGYKIKGYQEDIYYPAKMQKRNEYMVDNADIVIAVWDGTKGGTANCVKYAKKLGKKIIRLDPSTLNAEIVE